MPNQKLNIQIGAQRQLANNLGNLHRPGYVLIGWSLRNTYLTTGNPDFTLGQNVTIPTNVIIAAGGDVVLHAHWRFEWSGLTMPVTVHIYYDALFDTNLYVNAAVYRQELHNITHRAARSFERTFGIVMLVPTPSNMVQVRSQKNYCNTGVSPYFLCSCTGVNLPGPGCTQHHSSGDHMHNHVVPTPMNSTGSGLHTMFFTGKVCGNVVEGYRSGLIGMACIGGNRAIVSSGFVSNDTARARTNAIRVTQHEWSHNYGLYCFITPVGVACETTCIMNNMGWLEVMQEIYNVWCERCRLLILGSRDLHS